MWIPTKLYEALPAIYLAVGVSINVCALYIGVGHALMPVYLFVGTGCVAAGVVVMTIRHHARADRNRSPV